MLKDFSTAGIAVILFELMCISHIFYTGHFCRFTGKNEITRVFLRWMISDFNRERASFLGLKVRDNLVSYLLFLAFERPKYFAAQLSHLRVCEVMIGSQEAISNKN